MQCASEVDLDEAYQVGQFAVSKAMEGESDKMITLVRMWNEPYTCELGLVGLEKVALKTKMVPDEFISKESNFVTEQFIEYAKPLIGGQLPNYARLYKKRVQRLLPLYS